jgi:diguanylate cyclase
MKKTKMLLIFMVIIVISNLILSFACNGESMTMKIINDLLPVGCAIVSVVLLFVTIRKFTEFDFAKKTWLMIFSGILLYMLAEIMFAILELWFKMDMNENFPSAADIFWYLGYIPIFTGLIMMFLGYKQSGMPMGNIKLYFILGILLLLVMAIVISLLLIPIIQDPESDTLTKISSLYYPIGDLLVVIPALLLMIITSQFGSGTISMPWRYLAIGFLLFTISDLLYSYLSWNGVYKNGSIIDIGWNAGYLFIGIAGLYQKELIESIGEA